MKTFKCFFTADGVKVFVTSAISGLTILFLCISNLASAKELPSITSSVFLILPHTTADDSTTA